MTSDKIKKLINQIIRLSAEETMKFMFVRIVDGDRFKDVTPEVANCLRKKKMLYMCGHCADLHVEDGVTWETIEEQIKLYSN
jgi:hypothetical protein